ncbi:MAG: Rieske 2Fe-2S domain-containing protein [Chloroflexi bacterium]|nr:Rieske 2Fe-2S domain-containing protein [Chloroflexota bacterium]
MAAHVWGTGTSEYDALTRVGPGTPGGDLLRRYWHPVALAEEIPPGGAPVPVRIMSEDLVLFRDEQGRPGLLGLHCSHRGADLSYGRTEDGGLRCLYHGWLYDRSGRCLEQPGEPAGSTFHERIRHPAYPCVERADAIFAYLGPGEAPEFPNYEFLVVPNENVFAIKLFHACNWMQGNEGNIDLLHLSFVHHMVSSNGSDVAPGPIDHRGAAPYREKVEAELTSYGLRVCKVRELNDEEKEFYLCTYVAPNWYAFPGGIVGDDGHSLNWHVPVDDTHHWKFTFIFNRKQPLNKHAIRSGRQAMTEGYRSARHIQNRYLQDRESMDTYYAGMGTVFQAHDMCMTVGAGPIQDRSQEHLTTQDAAMVAARTLLLKGARDIAAGRDPQGVIRERQQNRFPRLFTWTSAIVPKDTDWKAYFHEKDREFEAELMGAR